MSPFFAGTVKISPWASNTARFPVEEIAAFRMSEPELSFSKWGRIWGRSAARTAAARRRVAAFTRIPFRLAGRDRGVRRGWAQYKPCRVSASGRGGTPANSKRSTGFPRWGARTSALRIALGQRIRIIVFVSTCRAVVSR